MFTKMDIGYESLYGTNLTKADTVHTTKSKATLPSILLHIYNLTLTEQVKKLTEIGAEEERFLRELYIVCWMQYLVFLLSFLTLVILFCLCIFVSHLFLLGQIFISSCHNTKRSSTRFLNTDQENKIDVSPSFLTVQCKMVTSFWNFHTCRNWNESVQKVEKMPPWCISVLRHVP